MNRLFLTAILACGCVELISSNQSISMIGNLAFAENSQSMTTETNNSAPIRIFNNSKPIIPSAVEGEEELSEDKRKDIASNGALLGRGSKNTVSSVMEGEKNCRKADNDDSNISCE